MNNISSTPGKSKFASLVQGDPINVLFYRERLEETTGLTKTFEA